jgi:serine/threonine protein phosphatase PrpC
MGNQKINQDALVSNTNINNIKDFNIFGILDGYGPQGHYVSDPQSLINKNIT